VITSKYKAYPPDGGAAKIVNLTNDAKRRYEKKGWRFERTLLSDWNR
jgi:hypothetical protein